MVPNSVILVDEMILPNSGAHFHATQMDITMMTIFATFERTEKEWHTLFHQAGLKYSQVWVYDESVRRAVIGAVLPPAEYEEHKANASGS